MEFKLAHPGEGVLLTHMAYESKSQWGYTPEIMQIWEPELLVDGNYIKHNIVYKIIIDQELVGFYAIRFQNDKNCFEIDHLWLKATHINKGIGRAVFVRILGQLKELGQVRVLLNGEPHARGFYKKMHGRIIEERQTKIPGLLQPVYEFDVPAVLERTVLSAT